MNFLNLIKRNPQFLIKNSYLVSFRNVSIDSKYQFKTLKITSPHKHVFHVEINRPDKRNAMNPTFFNDLRDCFNQIKHDKECRVILVSGSGKGFSSGIDLAESLQVVASSELEDVGRKSFLLKKVVDNYQSSFTAIENCHKPVIALVHGHCVGSGVEMLTACDLRYCSKDAWFTIKEVEMGLAADIGTLQRFQKIVGNDSLARELIYTSRKFTSDEAKSIGFINKIAEDEKTLMQEGLEMAKLIALKSPIAVQGSKVNLVFSRDHSVEDGLKFVQAWNSSMVQSEDIVKSVMAAMSKNDPEFSDL